MKLVVFGATGGVGRQLVQQAFLMLKEATNPQYIHKKLVVVY